MKRLALIALATLLLGCSKLTLENYQQIRIGMSYDEVVALIGKPARCDDLMGLRSCTWGDASGGAQVSFAGGKVILFSSTNLK